MCRKMRLLGCRNGEKALFTHNLKEEKIIMKARKGFTLVELLIVIAIIGILGSMMMISSTEATDSAKVAKITEGFRNVSSAMLMFYADNIDSCDRGTSATAIGKGAAKFLKEPSMVESSDTAITDFKKYVGQYIIQIDNTEDTGDQAWWIIYKLPQEKSRVAERLADRAKELGLKKEMKPDAAQYESGTGDDKVYMKVR